MPLDAKFYHSLSLATGGLIDAGNLVGSVTSTGVQDAPAGDVTDTLTSDISGGATTYFYRKLHLKNDETSAIVAPGVMLSQQTAPGQISLAREKTSGDTSVSNYVLPVGYIAGDFSSPTTVSSALSLNDDTSNLAAAASVGLWVRFAIQPGLSAAPGSSCRISLIDNVT